ncbi:MAG: glycosyltransferase family 2 protein [bacterium]|nr:glycosyltransferase family 2 protein [bacterium]
MKLSVVILTKNEEEKIEQAIRSALFADEILIIDDYSTDKTLEIAQKYKVNFAQRSLNNNFSQQRNFALNQAKGDWIFFLDADEVITSELKVEIKTILSKNSSFCAFYIKRRDIFWGRVLKHGELKTAYHKGIIRLIKKNSGIWEGNVHERFVTTKITGRLKGFINHYSHNSIKEFIIDINNYSTIRAKELQKKCLETNIFQILFYPIAKFKMNYIIKLGFLDGVPGFIYSFMMSFHSFLVRAKLYQYTRLEN